MRKVAEKQSNYSRLYFLTDSQLITLMSAIEPNTQVDVSVLFPGLEKIVIDATSIKTVVREGEIINLQRKVLLKEGSNWRPLEDWLSEFEQSLRNTHAQRIQQQYHHFPEADMWKTRADREAMYIAYLCWFTSQVNTAFSNEDVKVAFRALVETLKAGLASVSRLLRPKAGIPGQQQTTALVYNLFGVKEKAQNERVCELLICAIQNHLDFMQRMLIGEDLDLTLLWKSQFKLSATNTNSEVKECLSINIDCMDCVTPYFFEMHSSQSLGFYVHTPATQKCLLHCYLTLKHEKSVLLTGPAGVGKSETLAHLAILCGRLLHTSYPNTTRPFEAAIKSLIGCTLGGYWGCFEEIHSIPEMYLSSLAHYIRLIQSAFDPSPVRVTIEGVTMRPKTGFAIFATSLEKAPAPFHELFRCVHMPAPDLRIMCALLLQIHGLDNKYAELICRALEMLEQQPIVSMDLRLIRLKTKAGVRTLLRVIKAMLVICQRFAVPDMPYLINNALRKVYGVGLLPRELLVLDEFLATVFASKHNDLLSLTALKNGSDAVMEVLIDPKLLCQETMQRRCQHLLALLASPSRPWVFVVGGSLTGKSLIISEVAKAFACIEKKEFSVHKIGLGTSAGQVVQLFELICNASKLSTKFSQARFHSQPVSPNTPRYTEYDWIVLDCPSFSCSVLPSLRKSRPDSSAQLFVETEDLSQVSPDMVSEAGILFLEDQDMDTLSFYKVAIERIVPTELILHMQSLEDMYFSILKPALDLVERSERTIRLGTKTQILFFSKLLKPHLEILRKHVQRQTGTSTVPIKSAPLVLLKKSKTLITKGKHEDHFNVQEIDMNTNLMNYLGCVRKQFRQLEPQLCLEALYITCLANTLGNLIKDVVPLSHLLMKIVETKSQEYGYFLRNAVRDLEPTTLLDLRFSLKEMKWVHAHEGTEESQAVPSLSPRIFDIEGSGIANLEAHKNLETVLIPTKSMTLLRYWTNFCLRNHVDVIVCGPHQCGKSGIVLTVAKELLTKNYSGLVALNVSEYSTYRAVQASVQASLEHYKKWAYGGLGGTRYYAVLDDMNMDTGNQLYDMFRFWKDTSGWYNENFTTITDLTVAFVHSYSEGQSRPLWERALRHFFILHKSAYSLPEVEKIFSKFISAAGSDHLTGVAERARNELIGLFVDLEAQRTERVWCHASLSNFCMALQFLAQFEEFEARSEETFLSLWNFMHERFFGSQFEPTEMKELVATHLSNVLGDSQVEVTKTGVLLPSDDQDLQLLTSDGLARLVSGFQESHRVCSSLYPQYLKNLHSLIFQAEQRLADFYFFYLNTLFDIQSSCASVIIRSDTQLFLAKSLLFLAANTCNVKIFDLNLADREDFSSTIQDSFHGVSPLHIPTELKFTIKHVTEAAIIQNKKVVLVYTFFDARQLDLPIGRRLMEVANDILTGVKLRLSGFGEVYKDLLDKYQAEHAEAAKGMFNDEMLQILIDRMRQNVTLFFLVASKEETWIRSPLHPVGLLEKFKHKYRPIFNMSRIVDFDHLKPPAALTEYLRNNVSLQQLQYHNELLLEIGEAVQSMTQISMKDELTYECLIYCSKQYICSMESSRNTRNSLLEKACAQVFQLETALENAPTLLQELASRIESLEKELGELQISIRTAEEGFQQRLEASKAKVLKEAVDKKKEIISASMEQPRLSWETVVKEFQCPPEEAKEAEKNLLSGDLSFYAAFYKFLNSEASHASESDEQLAKKILSQLSKRGKETIAKLKRVDEDVVLSSLDFLRSLNFELPLQHKAEERIRPLLGAALELGNALAHFNEVTAEIDAECERIPETSNDLKTAISKERDERLSQLNSQISAIEAQLKIALHDQEQITLSRPIVQRLATDVKSIRDEWLEEIADTDQQAKDFGNSLISSVMLFKCLGLGQPSRLSVLKEIQSVLTRHEVRHSSGSLSELLQRNFGIFSAECSVLGIPEARLMQDNVAALRAVQELGLPMPVIFDPYDIAQEYILRVEEPHGLLVGKVSNDLSFEQGLRNCVLQGQPVLCIDPSASLMKVLMPILRWRSQQFVAKMRGLEPNQLQYLAGKAGVPVHPQFRLYICCKLAPSAEVLDFTTWINFDATDQESWEAFTSLPLLKLLDEQQYEAHLSQRSKAYHQALAIDQAEKELIQIISTQNLMQILSNEGMLANFMRIWKKMKNIPTEDESTNRRRPSILLSKADHRLPRDKLKNVMAELFRIKQTIATCDPLLKDYSLPSKVLHALIDSACAEYVKYIAIPLESQWDAFAECLAYRVFIRVCHALPIEQRQVFISFFAMSKYLERSPDKSEFFHVMNDIFNAGSLTFEQREAFIASNYPQVFTATFRPGTSAYQYFLQRPLYSEVRAPAELSKLLKYLVYAYLRPDLLPAFVRNLVAEVLGYRYTWLPKTDYSIYTLDIVKLPTVIFYNNTSPIFFLKHMAESRRITLVRTQPVFTTNMKSMRNSRSIGGYVDTIISALSDNLTSSRWITIENLQTVTGLEAEVLTKYLLYFIPQHVSDTKKIWVVLEGSPEQHPQWMNLIKHCQRIVMLEPETLHEHMLYWHYTDNISFFLQYRESITMRYWSHCSLDGRAPKMPFQDSEKPMKRDISDEQLALKFKFNVSALMSIVYLRNQYQADLARIWGRTDATRLAAEFLAVNPGMDLQRKVELEMFVDVMGPQLDLYSLAVLKDLIETVFSGRTAIEIGSIVYPLYRFENPVEEINLVSLIDQFPQEDNLMITGLQQTAARSQKISEAMVFLKTIKVLHQSLGGTLDVDRELFHATEKALVSDQLKKLLKELCKLPEADDSSAAFSDPRYKNVYISRHGGKNASWTLFSKEGFKIEDKQNSILAEPPNLNAVIVTLQHVEKQASSTFLRVIHREANELYKFLMYRRSAISTEDHKTLLQLAKNQVPMKWRELSPFVARQRDSADRWREAVVRKYEPQESKEILDLSTLFQPGLVLLTVLRMAALKAKKRIEKFGFQVDIGTSHSESAELLVKGFYLHNAELNPTSGVLEESDSGMILPNLLLRPAKVPAYVRKSGLFPDGPKLIMSPKGDEKSIREADFVFCPLELSEAQFWVLFPARQGQGFWSRRGVKIGLEGVN